MSVLDYIYGPYAVKALLDARPNAISCLFVQRGRKEEKLAEILSIAASKNIKITHETRQVLEKRLESSAHQGIVAHCPGFSGFSVDDLSSLVEKSVTSPLFLVLDGVQDPHNLGACLRSAQAMGAHAVIIPKDRAVGLTPTVHKVSCGAASMLPVIVVTNLARALRDLQELGVWCVGAEAASETPLKEIDLTGPIALIMGGEGQGLRRLTRSCSDYLASIPLDGAGVGSLNVSVAAGIALYEVSRQRG